MQCMVRTQIQLEKHVWEKLRERAFIKKQSVAALVRQAVIKELGLRAPKRKYRLADFTFVGAGSSKGPGSGRLSIDHDKYLADAFADYDSR